MRDVRMTRHLSSGSSLIPQILSLLPHPLFSEPAISIEQLNPDELRTVVLIYPDAVYFGAEFFSKRRRQQDAIANGDVLFNPDCGPATANLHGRGLNLEGLALPGL